MAWKRSLFHSREKLKHTHSNQNLHESIEAALHSLSHTPLNGSEARTVKYELSKHTHTTYTHTLLANGEAKTEVYR